MKNSLIALVIALAGLWSSASGQISLGPKAMLNLADVGNSSGFGRPRLGGAFGVSAEYQLSEKIGIGADILYSMQGYTSQSTFWQTDTLTGESTPISSDVTYKFDYLNLPIYVKLYPLKSHRFYAAIGIQPGLAVTRKRVPEDGKETDLSDYIESFDLSAPISIGYRSNMGLGFDFRYNVGITNVSKIEDELSNYVFQFGATYFFEL